MLARNRLNSIWMLLFWVILLCFTIVVYHTINSGDFLSLTPGDWSLIDNIYTAISGILILVILSSITSIIFREIKYSLGSEYLVIRKFLPTMRFTTILLIWIIGGFIILENLNVNTNGLLAGAGIGGAIFAIASRDIIANLLGSLSIILSKMFEIGDTIRIKNIEGVVEEINLSYTRVMSRDGKVVYIPNRTISTENLENLTRRRFYLYTYKIPFKKTIGDPDKVKDMLMMIEGKIGEYDPIKIEIFSEIPNASDFVYIFEIQMPAENEEFDREIRNFLVNYIFPRE